MFKNLSFERIIGVVIVSIIGFFRWYINVICFTACILLIILCTIGLIRGYDAQVAVFKFLGLI